MDGSKGFASFPLCFFFLFANVSHLLVGSFSHPETSPDDTLVTCLYCCTLDVLCGLYRHLKTVRRVIVLPHRELLELLQESFVFPVEFDVLVLDQWLQGLDTEHLVDTGLYLLDRKVLTFLC